MKTTLYFMQEKYSDIDEFLDKLDEFEGELTVSCSPDDDTPAVVSIGSFLQGFCGNLARYFHEEYHLPIGVLSANGEMMHVFNYACKDGYRYYFDVRGVTDDWDAFIAPFQQNGLHFETAEEHYGSAEIPANFFPEDEISAAMIQWLLHQRTEELKLEELAKGLMFLQYGGNVYVRQDEPFTFEKSLFYSEFEVMIDPEGNIVKALPSHQEFLINKCMERLGFNRDLLMAACPPEYYFDFMRWLIPMSGGWIPVWNVGVMDYPVTKKQLAALKKLKLHGFYKGTLPPVQA